ncbi:MAG TPA: glycoside hydrolase family 15 protein [Candidatus Angelobacter sp.]|nr:glycoside hydrolase family 15 protein [Candidatus Angelobacter sp.]
MRAVAYPAIERHGIIGDRRTAALVSADGVLDWLCLPDYDGHFIFGALLDFGKGGLWRLGPAALAQGEQTYDGETMVLQTEWKLGEGELLLQDAMLWPEDKRAPEQDSCRVIVRCLKCTKGRTRFSFDLRPGFDFADPPEISAEKHSSGWSIRIQDVNLRLWCNRELQSDASGFWCDGELNEGEEIWTVLEFGAGGHGWTVESAREALEKNRNYWRDWLKQIHSDDLWIRRSAMTVHLLTYAPGGSVVAAATTSVPERIGGAWNADYRLSWIRDASLAMGMLERLGDWQETERYLEWLHQRQSRFGMPLQVLYGIRGEKRERQTKLKSAAGYRGSVPVRVGNHAYNQYQLGSLGFLADCIWLYLQSGGEWNDKYWKLVRRLADYTCKHWTEPDNGIWELPERQHFVSSRVLCWVALDRAIRIAKKVKSDFDVSEWEAMAPKIHAEIMERGWSEKLGAFKQRYEAENLDAATLLISVLEFLPARHPRVLATIEKVNDFLTIDGYTYRFNPRELPVLGDFPLGQLEAAFLPCTFWLATAYAKAGEVQKAEAVLLCAERVAGRLGIFAEAVDPRTYCFMGNTPLLFSHVEYVRAKMEIARVKGEKEPSAP